MRLYYLLMAVFLAISIEGNAMTRSTTIKNLDPIFLERWSPRAFKKDPIPKEDLEAIFEAARWAPSCYNEQPWLFAYTQTQEGLKKFQSALVEFNQTWASNAPVLIIVFSKKTFDRNGKENPWAPFDTGAAWMSLALQAHKLGYITHAMGGFDPKKAFEVAEIDPTKYDVLAVIALGRQGDKNCLPEDMQKGESPSDRKPLSSIMVEK